MNRKFIVFSTFVGFIFAAMVSSGCSMYEWAKVYKINPVQGKWKYKDRAMGPHALMFTKKNTYELDYNGDGKKDIWGEYEIFEERLKLVDTGGSFHPNCGEAGYYEIEVKKDVVRFNHVADQCSFRRQALSVPWRRLPGQGFWRRISNNS